MIHIDNLTAGFQSHTVLQDISLELRQDGIFGLMGPGGVGKSTLLRTLGRWNDRLLSFWCQGRVLYQGRDLLSDFSVDEAHRLVPLLSQKAQLYTSTIIDNAIAEIREDRPRTLSEKEALAFEVLAPLDLWEEFKPVLLRPALSLSIGQQRKLSIARLIAGQPAYLLADEPLRDISAKEAAELQGLLRRISERLGVLMVTHNQQIARSLCSNIGLMVDGRLVEVNSAERFFSDPKTPMAREYIRHGSCSLGPDASTTWGSLAPTGADAPEESADGAEGADGEKATGEHLPGGFHWIVPKVLAGMQQPGLLHPEAGELEALAALGCNRLVTLRMRPYPPSKLKRYGMAPYHFPIVDMSVPKLADARDLCARIAGWMDDAEMTVLHCKAGLGRTGTMLACVLVYRGADAVSAVHEVRSINPYYIQSQEQLDFIDRFAAYIQGQASYIQGKIISSGGQ